MSYTNLVYHIVFRTYRSIPAIEETREKELYKYIYGFLKNYDCVLYRIGGMPDHIHMLVSIPPKFAVADIMRKVKYSSGKWIKDNAIFPRFSGWGEGYAAFTFSRDQIPVVKAYIMGQKEHHRVKTFAEEYREYIISQGGTIDERYFLKD